MSKVFEEEQKLDKLLTVFEEEQKEALRESMDRLRGSVGRVLDDLQRASEAAVKEEISKTFVGADEYIFRMNDGWEGAVIEQEFGNPVIRIRRRPNHPKFFN